MECIGSGNCIKYTITNLLFDILQISSEMVIRHGTVKYVMSNVNVKCECQMWMSNVKSKEAADVYSEPCERSKMECFAKIVNN